MSFSKNREGTRALSSEADIVRRRDEALRRALNAPPKPHEEMKIGKGKKRKPKASAASNVAVSKVAKRPSR